MIPGWKLGQFGKIEGARQKVAAAITAQPEIPAHWRTLLLAEIENLPAAHNWVTIHAHSESHEQRGDTHQTTGLHTISSVESL